MGTVFLSLDGNLVCKVCAYSWHQEPLGLKKTWKCKNGCKAKREKEADFELPETLEEHMAFYEKIVAQSQKSVEMFEGAIEIGILKKGSEAYKRHKREIKTIITFAEREKWWIECMIKNELYTSEKDLKN